MRNPSLVLSVLLAASALSARAAASPAGPVAVVADTTPPGRTDVAAFWHQLGDSTLDRLMAEALRANQDVRAAEAEAARSSPR